MLWKWWLALALTVGVFVGCTPGTQLRVVKRKPIDPYEAVQNGMTENQVIELMGAPAKRAVMQGEGLGRSGVYMRWVGGHKLINVYFVDGRVVGKEKQG